MALTRRDLSVDVSHAHHLWRNAYGWYPKSWPGVVGEWVYADLTPERPSLVLLAAQLRATQDYPLPRHGMASSTAGLSEIDRPGGGGGRCFLVKLQLITRLAVLAW